MIGIGTGAESFAISAAFFVVTSLVSLDSQKKDNSDSEFGSGDADDAVTFFGEAISFVFSVSGFQKNERSEMGFVHGVTGDETIFLGGPIQSLTTC